MNSLEGRLKALMAASLCGNSDAYRNLLEAIAQLMRAYFGKRLGPGYRDVEDLVQETVIAIHEKRSSYDIGRPFTAWLYAIARYKLVDHLRKNRLHRDVSLDEVPDLAAADKADACLAAVDVERLLAQIPAGHRTAIQMTRLEGRSIAETAVLTGRSESAIKVSVHRGLKRLARRAKVGDDRD